MINHIVTFRAHLNPSPFLKSFLTPAPTLSHHPPVRGSPGEVETKHASPSCAARRSSVQHWAHCIGCRERLCLKATTKQTSLKEISLIDLH